MTCKISQKCRKINSCLLVSTFTIFLCNSFFFLQSVIQSSSILRFLFYLLVNYRLSLVRSLSLNFFLWTHCPASNSLASSSNTAACLFVFVLFSFVCLYLWRKCRMCSQSCEHMSFHRWEKTLTQRCLSLFPFFKTRELRHDLSPRKEGKKYGHQIDPFGRFGFLTFSFINKRSTLISANKQLY